MARPFFISNMFSQKTAFTLTVKYKHVSCQLFFSGAFDSFFLHSLLVNADISPLFLSASLECRVELLFKLRKYLKRNIGSDKDRYFCPKEVGIPLVRNEAKNGNKCKNSTEYAKQGQYNSPY